jgi:hypothetical protein
MTNIIVLSTILILGAILFTFVMLSLISIALAFED